MSGVKVSVIKIERQARNPNDIARLDNVLSNDFYPLPFSSGISCDFPVGHKEEIKFVSHDSKNPECIVIGSNPGTLFSHKGRVNTVTVQAVVMGQNPSLCTFDVWIDNETLHVQRKSKVG